MAMEMIMVTVMVMMVTVLVMLTMMMVVTVIDIVMEAKINSNQKKSDKIVSKSAPGPIRGLSAILRLISPT